MMMKAYFSPPSQQIDQTEGMNNHQKLKKQTFGKQKVGGEGEGGRV